MRQQLSSNITNTEGRVGTAELTEQHKCHSQFVIFSPSCHSVSVTSAHLFSHGSAPVLPSGALLAQCHPKQAESGLILHGEYYMFKMSKTEGVPCESSPGATYCITMVSQIC